MQKTFTTLCSLLQFFLCDNIACYFFGGSSSTNRPAFNNAPSNKGAFLCKDVTPANLLCMRAYQWGKKGSIKKGSWGHVECCKQWRGFKTCIAELQLAWASRTETKTTNLVYTKTKNFVVHTQHTVRFVMSSVDTHLTSRSSPVLPLTRPSTGTQRPARAMSTVERRMLNPIAS